MSGQSRQQRIRGAIVESGHLLIIDIYIVALCRGFREMAILVSCRSLSINRNRTYNISVQPPRAMLYCRIDYWIAMIFGGLATPPGTCSRVSSLPSDR